MPPATGTQDRNLSIAVVGGGIAGITSAWLLSRRHRVTLIEANSYVGGHTNTIVLPDGPDKGTPVDTGFIVCNDRNYPHLHKLFDEWNVRVRKSDMSFGYFDETSGLAYAGTNLGGVFAQWHNAVNPLYWKLWYQIFRFNRLGRRDIRSGYARGMTLRDYLIDRRVDGRCVRDYVLPMGAAIWSTGTKKMLEFPAETYLRFFQNHGLLEFDMPQWQTVVGGSFAYVKAFLRRFHGEVITGRPVLGISRSDSGAQVHFAGQSLGFDRVVVATHADTALRLLQDPTPEERRLLGAWTYEKNHTVLHWDESLLPPYRRAWASWNYRREAGRRGESSRVSVTYHMNRLQGLRTRRQYCVTLNSRRRIDPRKVVAEILYTHPLMTEASVATQGELASLGGVRNTWFAGSYHGFGFHEDAARSGFAVARAMGIDA